MQPPGRLETLRANLLSGSALAVAGLVILLGGVAFLINQDDQVYINQRLADAAPLPRSGAAGARPYPSPQLPVGEAVKPITLYGARGEPLDLLALCGQDTRPLLMMTGSLTSSATARRTRTLKRFQELFGDAIRIAVVYTREAQNTIYDPGAWRPRSDATPGASAEAPAQITPPQSLEERRQLADRYRALTQLNIPVYIDGLDDALCEYLGGGTNMALLLDSHGRVLAWQNWFHGRTMARRIHHALEAIGGAAGRPS